MAVGDRQATRRLGEALRTALCAICLAAPAWGADARITDGQAAFQRGLAADLGSNGRPNPALAYRYYKQAASFGNADAELNLGVMNDSGVGTLADAAQAALWYARAASHGNGRAAFDLGQLYEAGDGVPQNRPLAAAWYDTAAQEGIAAASDRARRLLSALGASGPAAPLAVAAPVLVAPAAGSLLPARDVELVWQPASALPDVVYWVQIMSAATGQTLVYKDSTVSAMLLRLPDGTNAYLWRVFAAGPDHYRASDWAAFAVRAGDVCCLASLTSR